VSFGDPPPHKNNIYKLIYHVLFEWPLTPV
jgi:hypothetical protein